MNDDMLLVTDVGDCQFGASDLVLPHNSFLSNSYFASLGFGIPAALGAALAYPKKRIVVLVGDGAFQMTSTELSTAVRYGLDPIVVLFNNKGYGTERPLLEGGFNDIVNWNYSRLPELLGAGTGNKVSTEEELSQTLQIALATRGQFQLIEIDLDKYDSSNAAKRFATIVTQTVK